MSIKLTNRLVSIMLDINMEKNTQENILNCALELFSLKGFDACSMNDIAAEAKVNKATIYYYFKNKESVYEAVLVQILDDFYSHLENAVIKEKSPQRKLFAYIFAFGKNFQNTQKMAPLMLRELASGGSNLPIEAKKYILKNITLLHQIIEEGKEKNLFVEQEVFVLYLMIVGTMNIYTASSHFRKKIPQGNILSGFNLNAKELADYILNIVEKGIQI